MKTVFSFMLLVVACSLVPVQAQVGDFVHINGYGSFEYEYLLTNAVSGVRGDKYGSFDADGFDLVLNINPADRFRVAADLTWEHGPASEDAFGNVGFEYVFAEYTVADYLKIRAGKQFISFGVYNEIHTAKPAFLFVKEASSTLRTDRAGSPLLFHPRWGSGLSVTGSYAVTGIPFDYILQLTNGEHLYDNFYEKDYDKSKALNGRVRATFMESNDLTLKGGASFYSDDGDSLSLSSYGVQGEVRVGNFLVEGEYIFGSFTDRGAAEVSAYKGAKGVEVDRYGYYALVAYTIADQYTPYARWEEHDPNTSVDNNIANTFLVGLNIRVNDYLYLKCEVDRFLSEKGNSRLKGINYTELKTSVSFGF